MSNAQTSYKYLALALAVSTAQLAYSQEGNTTASSGFDIEEIVVTARKKEERLQDVPIAISAIGSELIASTGAASLEDVARLTPGFSFERTVGTLGQPSIRGVVQGRVSNPVQNVATFMNGVYLQRSYQVDSDLLNLERIEVVKGPQSAMFGRNAFGGAISYITKKPDLEAFKATVEVGVGSDELKKMKASVSIPLGGKAAFSLAASSSEFDGTWANENTVGNALDNANGALYTDGNVGGHDNNGYLVQFYAEPTDTFSVEAFFNHRDIFVESAANYQLSSLTSIRAGGTTNCYPFEAGNTNPSINGQFGMYCGELPVRPVLAPGEARPEGLLVDRRSYGQDTDSDVAGVSLNFDVSDTISLSYDYGYTQADAVNFATLSGDPVNGTFFGQTLFDSRGNGEIETESHDFRFNYENDGIRALVGIAASTTDDYSYGASYLAPPNSNTALNATPFPVGNLLGSVSATQRDEDISAIYGLVSFDVSDALTITVEGRETKEDITEKAVNFATGDTVSDVFNKEFSYFTPRVSATYSVSDDMTVYASGAKGTKSGGFNPQAGLPDEQVYDPEENTTYELGIKGRAFDGRLSYDAAIYMTDWTDLQGSRGQEGAVQGTPLILDNFSSADIKGFEMSGLFYATESITTSFGFSVSDAKFANDATDSRITRALCQAPTALPPGAPACPYTDDVGGNQMPRTPKYQANFGVAYDNEIGSMSGEAVSFFARADYSYQSKQYADPLNTAYVPDRSIVDASFGFYTDNWKLRVWSKNLFNEEYVSYAFTTIGIFTGAGTTYAPLLGDKRTFGASLTYTY